MEDNQMMICSKEIKYESVIDWQEQYLCLKNNSG